MTARIDEKLQAAVAADAVPGVVAMAAGPDGTIYEGAAGKRSAAADDPIAPDTMMRIASMTKMVTTTAALQLIERGSLSLDAPVKEYRPEFADLPVLTGFDGDTPQLRAPSVQATVRGRDLVVRGNAAARLDADITSENVRDRNAPLAFRVDADSVQAGGYGFERVHAQGQWRDQRLAGAVAIRQDARVSYAALGSWARPASGTQRIGLDSLSARFDTLTRISLSTSPARSA